LRIWEAFAAFAAARWSWAVAFLMATGAGALVLFAGANAGAEQPPVAVPSSAESIRAAALVKESPSGGQAPVILVGSRTDDAVLSPADLAAIDQSRQRVLARPGVTGGPPPTTSTDGRAALAPVSIPADVSGFDLRDAMNGLRAAATNGAPQDIRLQITGGPAFAADIADSFSGANFTLLAVSAAVVALLLIVTYRSPILWLVPLSVIAVADRTATALGGVVSTLTGLSADGSSTGITSVLVFGAGTNYALLLISRYREELTATLHHRDALRVAVRRAGPAILASNATVVLALLTLLLAAAPSTRALGVQAACGLAVAMLFVLVALPPLLAVFGRRLFWPFIPQRRGAHAAESFNAWYRVAKRVSEHAGRITIATVLLLAALSAGLLDTPIGLSQTDQFRVEAESVAAYDTLSAHFPAGLTDPTRVIGRTDRRDELRQAITDVPGVVSLADAGAATGLTQFAVVINAEPGSDKAFDVIDSLRRSVRGVDEAAVVGGSDALALDARTTARHDQRVVIPAILGVVLLVLYLLLRSALAPPMLVAVTVFSALAALGLGSWAGVHIFGFPALDNTTPLFAVLFLIALGVDYTIFLVTRAREESGKIGTRDGIVRAVAATGTVITSAGIVLAAVFAVLGVLPLIVLTQVGIVVGLGILLDTFLVRTIIIPALFTLVGQRIWWPADVDPKPIPVQEPGSRAGAPPLRPRHRQQQRGYGQMTLSTDVHDRESAAVPASRPHPEISLLLVNSVLDDVEQALDDQLLPRGPSRG
jgi:putative drug exporter of the RND superfamily